MQAVHHVRNSTLSNPVYCNSVNELHHLKLCHKYLLELQNLDCLWCIFRLGAVSSSCILGWFPRLPKPSIVGFDCKRKLTEPYPCDAHCEQREKFWIVVAWLWGGAFCQHFVLMNTWIIAAAVYSALACVKEHNSMLELQAMMCSLTTCCCLYSTVHSCDLVSPCSRLCVAQCSVRKHNALCGSTMLCM